MKTLSTLSIIASSLLLTACFNVSTNVPVTSSTLWYIDADADNYGDVNDAGTASTIQPSGYVNNNFDCDDNLLTGASISPDNIDVKDGIDNDCDGSIDGVGVSYSIGDKGPAGGIVFHISNAGIHGLEAAPTDQDNGAGAEWGCDGTIVSGADGLLIGTGMQNTVDILAAACVASTRGNAVAADLVYAYSLNGFNDWFLPSRDEINILYNTIALSGTDYWSSSEHQQDESVHAWSQVWSPTWNVKYRMLSVRAIRAF